MPTKAAVAGAEAAQFEQRWLLGDFIRICCNPYSRLEFAIAVGLADTPRHAIHASIKDQGEVTPQVGILSW